jgi:hypothetical protein
MQHIISFILAHALSWLVQIYRFANAAIKDHLRLTGADLAYGMQTASTMRCGRVRLRWYQRRSARELQSEGRGIIRDGYYETWVSTVPPVIRQELERSASRGWGSYDDYY